MTMEKRYPVRIIRGKYKNMTGWTPYEKPNAYGNIMFYFDQGSYPYRVCISKTEFEYI